MHGMQRTVHIPSLSAVMMVVAMSLLANPVQTKTESDAGTSLRPNSLTIVTHLSTSAEGSFGPHALAINDAFAARHGHRFEVVHGDHRADDRDPCWSKVAILREKLHTSARDDSHEEAFFLWMDSDAVFTNFNFSLLNLAQQMLDKGAHIAVCKDLSVPKETSRQTCGPLCLNTGTLMLRNSEWTRSLLVSWWQAADAEFASFRHGLHA
jgi:hypothetical protein